MRPTSVAIPAQEMGRSAAERLATTLEGRGGDEAVLGVRSQRASPVRTSTRSYV